MPLRDASDLRIKRHCASPANTTQRPIGNQLDVVLQAVSHDAVEQVILVPEVQLDLHRRDLGDATSLFDLPDVDVAQTDSRDQTFILQRRERTHTRRQRNARIHGVKLIEIDPLDAERRQTRFARFP
jgi:hypothetical protein